MTDWAAIIETEEYQRDMLLLPELHETSLANPTAVDRDDPFIQILSHLNAILRHHIRNLPDQKDLDLSEFTEFIAQEIALDLPLTDAVPRKEFMRESKNWYGRKGTERLYEFAGDLIGSQISIHYPAELIFRLSHRRSFLSGKMAGHQLSFEESCLARLRDGEYWANYVYVLTAQQAQLVKNFSDLLAIVQSVHPAGTKMFLNLNYNFLAESLQDVPTEISLSTQYMTDYYRLMSQYPTLDNNWILSSRDSRLSMHGGSQSMTSLQPIIYYPLENFALRAYRRLTTDSQLHQSPVGRPWVIFSINYPIPGDGDDYVTQYADDNDALAYHQETNMGIGVYEYELIKDRPFKELKHIAFNLDYAKGDTELNWLPQMAHAMIIDSILIYQTYVSEEHELTPDGPDTFTMNLPATMVIGGDTVDALPINPNSVKIAIGSDTYITKNSAWLVFNQGAYVQTPTEIDISVKGAIEFDFIRITAGVGGGTLISTGQNRLEFVYGFTDIVIRMGDDGTYGTLTIPSLPPVGQIVHWRVEWEYLNPTYMVYRVFSDYVQIGSDQLYSISDPTPTALFIGENADAGSPVGDLTGIIQNVEVWNATDTLVHKWKIDDDGATDGEPIVDSIGTEDGTLQLDIGTASVWQSLFVWAVDDGDGNIVAYDSSADFTGSTIDYATGEVDLVITDSGVASPHQYLHMAGDSHVELPVAPDYSVGGTWEFDVFSDGVDATRYVIGIHDNVANRGVTILTSSAGVLSISIEGAGAGGWATLTSGQWNHIKVQWIDESGTMKCYFWLNGVAGVGTGMSYTPSLDNRTVDLAISRGGTTSRLKGGIKNVQLFDDSDTLVNQWNVDDGSADTGPIADSVGTDDGVLVLGGSSAWEDDVATLPVLITADFNYTS